MKRRVTTILIVLILLVGICLLIYPSFSNWWNSLHQSRAVSSYISTVSNMTNDEYIQMWKDARAYNEELTREEELRFKLTDEETERYNSLLDVSGTGIMGYVDVPKINVTLPIYHGTDDSVLQIAIGHITGTSLPVGGPGSHCVISGHRGLSSARLFTDLTKVEIGDTFSLHVLDNILTYEVDQILTVLPDEVDALKREPGKDYCTLVTCTPYGINSHRLLVRGHRVEDDHDETIHIATDALPVNKLLIAACVALPLIIIILIVLLIIHIVRGKKRKNIEA